MLTIAKAARDAAGAAVAHDAPPGVGPAAELDFLAGGGEVGALVRAYDWAATSLGPPAWWPRGLRNAFRLLLTAPYPMWMCWGPERLHLHNDAYARLLGPSGRTRSIGPADRMPCTGICPTAGPLLDRVLRRSESSVVEDHLVCLFRNGCAEETYLTFRFDPIPDAGVTGGVLATVTETTDCVISRRRTATLRALASAAGGARSVEEACRQAMAELARRLTDVAFALLYLRNGAGARAQLVATAGLPPGSPASPPVIELDARGSASDWPVAAALASGEAVAVADLPACFGTLPAGDWPLAPRSALVVPLTPPGCEQPEGVLIAGVSARRALDAEYRGFLDLVARQVTAAMAGGRAFEDERRHAEAAAVAARRARARRRARERALEARFAGVLEERNRMAREIHDTLLQGFTGITLQLQAALPEVTRRPAHARAQMERMLEQADAALADARRAVWDLRTPALQAESLAVALEDVARRAAEGDAPDVRFRVVGTPRPLVPAVEMALFRIGQEAVANAAKHAGASAIEVQLAYERRGARLVVRDDGRGFDPAATDSARGGHWGLVGMRERAEQVGARLAVTSAEGRGTEVVVVAPAR